MKDTTIQDKKVIVADYQEWLNNEGVSVSMSSFYEKSEYMIFNPPDHGVLINKIIKMLEGTGISKIKITFLSHNKIPK